MTYDERATAKTLDSTPLSLTSDEFAAVTGLVADPDVDCVVRAAYVYDRKGYLEADAFGSPRNPAYSSDTDTILVQVSFEIPAYAHDEYALLKGMDERLRAEIAAEKIAKAEAEIARHQAALAAAQAELDRLHLA